MQITFRLPTFFLIGLGLLLFTNCSDENAATETNDATTQIIENVIEEVVPKKQPLKATIDYLRMREKAGTTGGVLATFNTGDEIYFLDEVSDFTTAVEIRGIKYNEPWLKVEDKKGKEGWIYAGGVKFDLKNANDNMKQTLENRTEGLFGKEVSRAIWNYYKAYETAKTDQDFYEAYLNGAKAQEALNAKMEANFPEPKFEGQKPDLSWIEEVMPAYKLGSAAEGTIYYLYKNFKQMDAKTDKTRGNADDDFMALQRLLYPEDGIEYFFPSYFLQTWDYGGHSLLGDGKHNAILNAANEFRAKHPGFFETETEKIRENLVNDIIDQVNGYWNDAAKINDEINEILIADYGILTVSDKAAIKEFKKQMTDYEANEIKVNMRGGAGH